MANTEVKDHHTYTLGQLILDHLHFVDSLAASVYTVCLPLPPWYGFARNAGELIGVFMFTVFVFGIIALPRLLLWFLFPHFKIFVGKVFPFVYTVWVVHLAVRLNVESWIESKTFTNSFRTVLESLALGMGGLASFKIFSHFSPKKFKVVPGFCTAAVLCAFMLLAWPQRTIYQWLYRKASMCYYILYYILYILLWRLSIWLNWLNF